MGGSWFRVSLDTKLVRYHLNRKELVLVVHACHPSTGRMHKIEGVMIQTCLGQK
jgi:hypothetical protein